MPDNSSIFPPSIANLFGNGGNGSPGSMGPADTFANGYGVGNLPVLPAGFSTGASGATGVAGATGQNLGAGTSFGPNLGTAQLGFSGLQTLGGLWNAYQSNALANKAFNFESNLANTNLANQTQAYNTNLSGQATARYAQENNPGGAAAYITANQLPQKTIS